MWKKVLVAMLAISVPANALSAATVEDNVQTATVKEEVQPKVQEEANSNTQKDQMLSVQQPATVDKKKDPAVQDTTDQDTFTIPQADQNADQNTDSNAQADDQVKENIQITVDTQGKGVFLNGVRLTNGQAMVKDNIAYVPLKMIVEDIYGGNISWTKDLNIVNIDICNLRIDVVIGAKSCLINDQTTEISLPLIIENGVIYCPVKTLQTLFNMQLNYVPKNPVLSLTAPVDFKPAVITTFAEFELGADVYVQGQQMTVTDKSYDEQNKEITQREWMLDNNNAAINGTFNGLVKNIKPGKHSISLRVKNSSGVWSEWTSHDLTIEPNQKPVVTNITSKKDSYGQGELLDFSYDYTNEDWEGITNERWCYKKVGEDDNNKVFVKPDYIFCEGDYVVGLQIQDAFGNWSDLYTSTFHINDQVYDTELNYKFNKNEAGVIIDNFQKKNYRDYEEVVVQPTSTGGGRYILSDSPESVQQNGILYQDTINGEGRINVYHCNKYPENPRNRKIVVMAENVTAEPVNIRVSNKIVKGPSSDALFIGQQLLYDYLKGNGNITYTLKPGEKMFIVDTKDKNWDTGTVISTQFDVNTSGEVKFTIASADKDMTTASIPYLPYLAPTIHPRGTFDITDMYYDIVADGSKETYFVIGKGAEEWTKGRDAILNKEVVASGNYGIVYHLKITAQEDMGIILNPRGGSFRGAVRIDGMGTYLIPKNSFFGRDSSKAAVIKTISKGQTVEIEYALPNGSSSPILFAMIPKQCWK